MGEGSVVIQRVKSNWASIQLPVGTPGRNVGYGQNVWALAMMEFAASGFGLAKTCLSTAIWELNQQMEALHICLWQSFSLVNLF